MARQHVIHGAAGPVFVNATSTRQHALAGITINEVSGTTISTVTAAAITYTGQAIATNARRNSIVTAGALTYAGQAIVNNARTQIAVIAAAITYAGQAIGNGAGIVSRVMRGLRLGLGLGL